MNGSLTGLTALYGMQRRSCNHLNQVLVEQRHPKMQDSGPRVGHHYLSLPLCSLSQLLSISYFPQCGLFPSCPYLPLIRSSCSCVTSTSIFKLTVLFPTDSFWNSSSFPSSLQCHQFRKLFHFSLNVHSMIIQSCCLYFGPLKKSP